MDKKDRTQEFIELFMKSVEEVKKLKSLGELSVTSDSCFGGIVRSFGKANILSHLAMLAASEIQITNFSEEKINEIKEQSLEKLKGEFKKYYGTDEDLPIDAPSVKKKEDLN
jgi:hypothetical protein